MENNNTTLKMKKTLLIAAAALVAATVSTEAQVYSANIVGYVNVVSPVANQYSLLANPLDNGTNNLTSLFPLAPNQTQVELWNGTGFQLATKQLGNWTTNLTISVGTGFFIKYPNSAGVVTNTFVGNVVVQTPNATLGSPSGTNNTSLPTTYVLVGSAFPYSGNLTASGDGTVNLGTVLANQSQVETWTGTGYQLATKQLGNWTTNLNLSVGQGFFVKSHAATNWVQSLTVQ
jgi:hypothetical protein